MSDLLQKAKQAAEECCQGLLDEPAMAHIIQRAIDSATAKLQEELAVMHKGFAGRGA